LEAAGAGDGGPLRARLIVDALMAVAVAAGHGAALAAVHTCVDSATKRTVLSDTPCPQEAPPTPAEIASQAKVAHDKQAAIDRQEAAAKADRQLLSKFPDEAAHRKLYLSKLDSVNGNIRLSAARFTELVAQRKPLDDEVAFYNGKPLPLTLRRKLEANDASFNALTDVFNGLRSDVAAIEATRTVELDQLRKLWAGARRVDGMLVMPTSLSAGK
jgi:hypothetical protein